MITTIAGSKYTSPVLIITSLSSFVIGLLAFINVIPNIGHTGAGILMGGIPSLGLVLFCIGKSRQTPAPPPPSLFCAKPVMKYASPRANDDNLLHDNAFNSRWDAVLRRACNMSPRDDARRDAYIQFLNNATDDTEVARFIKPMTMTREQKPVTLGQLKQDLEEREVRYFYHPEDSSQQYYFTRVGKQIVVELAEDGASPSKSHYTARLKESFPLHQS